MSKFPITQKAYEKLEQEIKDLKYIERPKIVEDIAAAREFGDLSENAEYHAAREKQSFTEGRILDLEDKMAKKENIAYQRSLVSEWEDGGTIMPFISRSQSDLKSLFSNCCQADLITLLHGKLYRCPFSANGANLNAFPFNAKDEVNLLDEKLSIQELRKQIKNLCFEKEYLTACSYCKGRTFESEKIKAAVQIKEPLNYSKLS